MRAVQFTGAHEASVADVDEPSVGEDDVLLRSLAVGICHSDLELLSGQYIIPFQYPVTPGHEWCAEVVGMGSAVEGFTVGDRVVGECVVGPGGRDHFGFNINGAAAQLFKAKGEWLHKVPGDLSDTLGALVEPFSVAYNAVRHAGGVDPSDHVAVLGGGPIGLLSVMAAAAYNARVTLIEPEASRRELGLASGARDALDPTDAGFNDAVAELTDGRGFEAVIEAAGAPAAMAQAIDIAAHSGRIAYAGINIGSEFPAPMGLIQSKALTMRGLIGSMHIWPESIRFLASGVIDPAPLVTATYDIEDAIEAYGAASDTDTNIKVHIRTGS